LSNFNQSLQLVSTSAPKDVTQFVTRVVQIAQKLFEFLISDSLSVRKQKFFNVAAIKYLLFISNPTQKLAKIEEMRIEEFVKKSWTEANRISSQRRVRR
jgi:hypothetical protein